MTAGRRPRADVAVREMTPTDLEEVLAIERATYPAPWSRSMFLGELLSLGAVAIVAEDGGRVVGYLLASDQAGVWHVLNVTVHPGRRGEGIGERLMLELFARADERGHQGYTLEVRVSNERAIRLYERLGFARCGIRPRYYSDNGEDALIMSRSATPEAA